MSETVFEVEVTSADVDIVVEEPAVAAVLIAGPAGPPGPQGESAASYLHEQVNSAATWSVTHTLGRVPNSVSIVVGGELVHTDVEFPSASTVVVTFAQPQAGYLRLA